MRRLAIGLGLMLLALPLAAACGGVVETSHDPGKSTATQSSGAAGKSMGNATDNPDANTDLGDCKLGPAENYASDLACAWVADAHCYATREMACNCACPRSHNSQCVSGFESGANGHVGVVCN